MRFNLQNTIMLLTVLATPACAESNDNASDSTRRSAAPGVVVSCGNELGVDSTAAFVVDWNDDPRPWNVEVTDTTITLSRTSMCGDECGEILRIVFANPRGPCPTFQSATVTTRDSGEREPKDKVTATATKGRLMIQDWNFPDGVISGKLESEIDVAFYVELSDYQN